jgi:hypothetical protein
MRTVRVGNGRVYDVPTSFNEGAEMIIKEMALRNDRGRNLALNAVCARVAYGLFNKDGLIADPTDALAYLMERICIRQGAGLDKPLKSDESDKTSQDQGTR